MAARQGPQAPAQFTKTAGKSARPNPPAEWDASKDPQTGGPPRPAEDVERELQQLWNVQFTEGEDDDDMIYGDEAQIDVTLEEEAANRVLSDEQIPAQVISPEDDYDDEDDTGKG